MEASITRARTRTAGNLCTRGCALLYRYRCQEAVTRACGQHQRCVEFTEGCASAPPSEEACAPPLNGADSARMAAERAGREWPRRRQQRSLRVAACLTDRVCEGSSRIGHRVRGDPAVPKTRRPPHHSRGAAPSRAISCESRSPGGQSCSCSTACRRTVTHMVPLSRSQRSRGWWKRGQLAAMAPRVPRADRRPGAGRCAASADRRQTAQTPFSAVLLWSPHPWRSSSCPRWQRSASSS
jgi:hypothetical protein